MIEIISQSLSGLIGTMIGFWGSWLIAKQQQQMKLENEKQLLLIKEKESVYINLLEWVQDFETYHKNTKEIGFTKEDIHDRLYCLLAKLEIYGSENVKEAFNVAKKEIENNEKNTKKFQKVVAAIREDLGVTISHKKH